MMLYFWQGEMSFTAAVLKDDLNSRGGFECGILHSK